MRITQATAQCSQPAITRAEEPLPQNDPLSTYREIRAAMDRMHDGLTERSAWDIGHEIRSEVPEESYMDFMVQETYDEWLRRQGVPPRRRRVDTVGGRAADPIAFNTDADAKGTSADPSHVLRSALRVRDRAEACQLMTQWPAIRTWAMQGDRRHDLATAERVLYEALACPDAISHRDALAQAIEAASRWVTIGATTPLEIRMAYERRVHRQFLRTYRKRGGVACGASEDVST